MKKFDKALMGNLDIKSPDINKLVARDIKKTLIKLFNIKFSVTSNIYNINVKFDDSLLEVEKVKEVVGHYTLLTSDTIYINNQFARYSDTIEYQEKKKAEYEAYEKEREEKIEANNKIYNDNVKIDAIVNYKEINTTDKNVFVKALEPAVNKNCWKINNDKFIDEKSYINKYKVEKIVILGLEEYNYFKFNLLNDYDFLQGQGGTFTDDETNEVLYNTAVAVVCEGQETIVIDPQGYSYARYTCRLIEDINNDLQAEVKETVKPEVEMFNSRINDIKDNALYNYTEYASSYKNINGRNVEILINDERLILDDSYNDYIMMTGKSLKEFISDCNSVVRPVEEIELKNYEVIMENLRKVDLGLIRCLLDDKDPRITKIKMLDRLKNQAELVGGLVEPINSTIEIEETKEIETITKLKVIGIEENNTNVSVDNFLSQFDYKKFNHTKTGEELHLLKLKEKIDKKAFKNILFTIKSMGGYYSKFKGGFIFKESPML